MTGGLCLAAGLVNVMSTTAHLDKAMAGPAGPSPARGTLGDAWCLVGDLESSPVHPPAEVGNCPGADLSKDADPWAAELAGRLAAKYRTSRPHGLRLMSWAYSCDRHPPYGAVLAEQHDKWAEQRRYLGVELIGRCRTVLTPAETQEAITTTIPGALSADA